jgi:hypothetical protein
MGSAVEFSNPETCKSFRCNLIVATKLKSKISTGRAGTKGEVRVCAKRGGGEGGTVGEGKERG